MSVHRAVVVAGSLSLASLVPTRAHALELEVGPLVRGQNVDFTITGATPGVRVYLIASAQTGNGPCPQALGGLCVDLVNPVLLGSVTASASGSALLPRTVAAGTTLGDYWFQVVQVGPSPAVSAALPRPVLQILQNELIVGSQSTYTEAVYTLAGDIEFAAGVYPSRVTLPYLQTGVVSVTRVDLDGVTLPAWLSGSLLVGPASGVITDPPPRAEVTAPNLTSLVDLDAWAWDLPDLDLPALEDVAAVRMNVVGPDPGRITTIRFPSLTTVAGVSLRGLAGLDFSAPGGRRVTVDLGAFDGLRFLGARLAPVAGYQQSSLDIHVGGAVDVVAPSLQLLPGTMTLDGQGRFEPWIDAPRLTDIGLADVALGGLHVTSTTHRTLDGLLPALERAGQFRLTDNPDLYDVGLVGAPGMHVGLVDTRDNPSLTGWTPDSEGWATDSYVSEGVVVY
ncbi:MAG: hypothetical protein H6738_17500 [Alphaproteobacteria bacterium]|nr:hypothetical protein [Alphaproteobacteria bacterium]MCB9698580.1 hypothetical protein [Alphaproteobacteria bacterium]